MFTFIISASYLQVSHSILGEMAVYYIYYYCYYLLWFDLDS